MCGIYTEVWMYVRVCVCVCIYDTYVPLPGLTTSRDGSTQLFGCRSAQKTRTRETGRNETRRNGTVRYNTGQKGEGEEEQDKERSGVHNLFLQYLYRLLRENSLSSLDAQCKMGRQKRTGK